MDMQYERHQETATGGTPDKKDDKADHAHRETYLPYGCRQDTQRILRSHTVSGELYFKPVACANRGWKKATSLVGGRKQAEGKRQGRRGTCRGVGCASVATRAMVRPHSLSAPTATTSMRPLPSVTCPARHTQPSIAQPPHCGRPTFQNHHRATPPLSRGAFMQLLTRAPRQLFIVARSFRSEFSCNVSNDHMMHVAWLGGAYLSP